MEQAPRAHPGAKRPDLPSRGRKSSGGDRKKRGIHKGTASYALRQKCCGESEHSQGFGRSVGEPWFLREGRRVGLGGGRLAIWAPEEGVPGKACQVKAPRSDCVRSRRELCPQRGRGPKGLAVVKAQPWTGTGVESATVGSEQRRASDSISFPSSKHPFGRSLGACQGGSRGREGGVGILDALPLGAGANRMRWRGGGGKREERMTQANPPPVLGLSSWREGVSAGRAGIAG